MCMNVPRLDLASQELLKVLLYKLLFIHLNPSLGSMMLSSAGCWQSTVNFTVSASQQGRSLSPAPTSWRVPFPSSS